MNTASKMVGYAVRAVRSKLGLDVFQTWNSHPVRSGKLCLFAHWDPHGIIDEYVLHYLRAIADQGFTIRLASSSSRLDPISLDKARQICDQVIWRRNVGVDFGSWHDAERSSARLAEFDELFLTNDSVFGPIRDLGPIFAQTRIEPASLWGLTDNLENGQHLQSYFLVIPNETLRSVFFRRFWREMVPMAHRWSVIHRYEAGLSQRAIAAGGRIRAVFQVEQVLELARSLGDQFQFRQDLEEGRAMNSTLLAWDVLIRERNFPLIKTDVLKNDRYRSHSLRDWPDLFSGDAKPLVDIIIRYLRRAHPNSAALRAL